MSLIATVTSIIKQHNGATLYTIEPLCPGYTRSQVKRAIYNARATGLIEVSVRGKSKGNRKGRWPNLYVIRAEKPVKKWATPAVNSVWGMAAA